MGTGGHNPGMRRLRRTAALLGLTVLGAPFVSGVATLIHVTGALESHHHDGHDIVHHGDDHHDVDIQQVWHGHRHDDATPKHGHPSAFASVPALLGPSAVRVPVQPSHSIDCADQVLSSGRGFGCVFVPGRTGAGPPPLLEPPNVLRI